MSWTVQVSYSVRDGVIPNENGKIMNPSSGGYKLS